jgi:protein involved in polysaccharide export with SLBB domain
MAHIKGHPAMRVALIAWILLAITVLYAAGPEYQLSPGDAIQIRFYYNDDLNDSTVIRPDGRIALPLIGEVEAAGRSPADLSAALEKAYASTLRRPAVTVKVNSFSERRFFVGGEVIKPGVQPLVTTQTVLGALLDAGGMTKLASTSAAYVIRRKGEGVERIRVPLKVSGNAPPLAATFQLQPLDVVLVAEARISRANRWMDQYVRNMLPVLTNFGFSYLINGGVVQ